MTTAHAFATDGLTDCPFMPVFGPPQVMFVTGRGTELWDSDGKRYLDFLGGLAVIVARPRQPGRRRGHRRRRPTSCCTSATCSPTRSPTEAADRGRPPAGRGHRARRAGLLHQLRRRGQRVRAQAGPQARRPRPPRRRQRARQLPRPHAGRARRHRPADQARAVPADARGLPPRGVGRRRRPRQGRRRHRRRRADRAGAGRGRRQPGARRLPRRRSASSATRPAR